MNKIYLYYPDTMAFFGERACKLFGWERYSPGTMQAYFRPLDTIVFWLYSQYDYHVFNLSECKRRVLWMGTDARIAVQNPFCREILTKVPAVHACMGQTQQDLLSLIGIESVVRPFFFSDPERYKPRPQKSEVKDIYTYISKGREEEHGLFIFLQAAQGLTQFNFHVFGIGEYIPFPNVKYYGLLNESEYDDLTDSMDLYVMGHVNQGYSQSAAKAGMRGQQITSINTGSYISDQFHDFKELCFNIETGNASPGCNIPYNQMIPEINQTDWI